VRSRAARSPRIGAVEGLGRSNLQKQERVPGASRATLKTNLTSSSSPVDVPDRAAPTTRCPPANLPVHDAGPTLRTCSVRAVVAVLPCGMATSTRSCTARQGSAGRVRRPPCPPPPHRCRTSIGRQVPRYPSPAARRAPPRCPGRCTARCHQVVITATANCGSRSMLPPDTPARHRRFVLDAAGRGHQRRSVADKRLRPVPEDQLYAETAAVPFHSAIARYTRPRCRPTCNGSVCRAAPYNPRRALTVVLKSVLMKRAPVVCSTLTAPPASRSCSARSDKRSLTPQGWLQAPPFP